MPGVWSGLLCLVILEARIQRFQMQGLQERIAHAIMMVLCVVVALAGNHFTLRRVRAAEAAHVAEKDRWPSWFVEPVVLIGFAAVTGTNLLLVAQLYRAIHG